MTDIAPTVLDLAGIPHPTHVDGIEQEPLHGATFTASLADAGAPEHHTQQYFEAVGNRAMYKDGWWFAQRRSESRGSSTRRSSAVSAQAGTPTRTRLSSTTSPTTSPRRGTSRTRTPRGSRSFEAVLGGGGALQRAAAARRAQLLLRHRPADPQGVEVHLPREDRERPRRNDHADLQPLVHDQRRPHHPRRRGRGRDRRSIRPPRRLRALRPGREAKAPLLDAGRARVHARVGGPFPRER